MKNKTLIYVVLAIAAAGIAYYLTLPKDETNKDDGGANLDSKGGGLGDLNIGNLLGGGLNKISEAAKNLIKGLFGGSEAQRYSDLLNSWINKNAFKISNGQGIGDFYKGTMQPQYWPELETKLNDYVRYVHHDPTAWKADTKPRVIRRYQSASREVRQIVRDAIAAYNAGGFQ